MAGKETTRDEVCENAPATVSQRSATYSMVDLLRVRSGVFLAKIPGFNKILFSLPLVSLALCVKLCLLTSV